MNAVKLSRIAVVVLGLIVGTGSGQAKPDSWLRVSTGEFTLITPLDEKEAAAWTTEFSQYIAALRAYFHRPKMRLPPLTIVVFGRERDFESFHPLGANGKPQDVGGFFCRHESWAVAGLSTRMSDEVRRTIFHEGVHWFLSPIERPNPVWLEEGLAEVFSTFRVEKGQAEWGRAIDSHVTLLQVTRPWPLERILFTAQGDLFTDDSLRTSIVYAESWAFVHFLMFGEHDIPRKGISDYTGYMNGVLAPAEAFQRAFGRSFVEMDGLLARYLEGGRYFLARQPLAPTAPPTMSPATTADVDEALGRLALGGRHYDVALSHARALVAAEPDAPRSHELLGTVLKESGDENAARAEFDAAIQHDSRDFQPYFEVAVATQNRAIEEQGPSISPQLARRIANRYEQAINLHQRFRPSYENLANLIGVVEPLRDSDRQFLEQGAVLYPQSGSIGLGLAQIDYRTGKRKEAHARLDKLLAPGTNFPGSLIVFARQVEAGWAQREAFERIDELTSGGKFADALAYIDEQIAGADTALRLRLAPSRRAVQVALWSQQVQQALEQGKWTEARHALGEILQSDAPTISKRQAQHTLDQLDQKHLGSEPARP